MPTVLEKRKAAADAAEAIALKVKNEGRSYTSEEADQVKAHVADIAKFDGLIKASAEADALIAGIKPVEDFTPKGGSKSHDGDDTPERSLGAHFVKYAGDYLAKSRGNRFMVDAPEYKAAADTHMTTTTGTGLLLPEYDFNIVRGYRRRLTIADWLGSGTLSSNAITYFVERPDSAIEGAFATVAEGATKPQIHMPGYDPVTESLKKIAGWIKISDEMTEDMAFLVSEIENRLLYQLSLMEEDSLLTGNGVGTNIKGLLNVSGLQTETSASSEDNIEALFRALTKVQMVAQLDADGIAINPLDYQKLRLLKDANNQYLAGGPFSGQYGQGGILQDPPLWATNTIVTPAIPQGTALVGAGKQAATVYRKGGVKVDATNTEGNDFINNLVTIRAEERLTLAVRRPSAFVKVSLSNA